VQELNSGRRSWDHVVGQFFSKTQNRPKENPVSRCGLNALYLSVSLRSLALEFLTLDEGGLVCVKNNGERDLYP
jgi:hypothetical protein